MASKRKRTAQRKRGNSSRRSSRSGPSRAALLAGVLVVALLLVAAIVLLDQSAAGSQAGVEAETIDKALGAADAPVVVIEYADYQCPWCKRFAEGAGQQLREEYVASGEARFVIRNLAFLGDESVWAAEAAECAEDQDRFWDYHDKLYAEQGAENSGAFSRDNLKRLAAELGLDTAAFDGCLDSGEYGAQVRAERLEAQQRQIRSTPSLLVNGQLVENGASYAVLQAAIEAELAQAGQ
jgi:protein-disulfide isomerase